jgi:hypothetical protein
MFVGVLTTLQHNHLQVENLDQIITIIGLMIHP